MRKLLNTLYVTSPNSYLSLDGENVVVLRDESEAARLPLHNLEGIFVFGYTGASPALMGACAKRNISLCFLTPNGRFLARVTGEVRGNVTLRKAQYRVSEREDLSLDIAKSFITGKVYNAKWVIERAIRDYAQRLDATKLKQVSTALSNSLALIQKSKTLGELRGYEGEAASLYFGVMDDLILQQKEDFCFSDRNKRPPVDNINAMLSFVYTLLAHDSASALEAVGLDPYVGFLQTPGRPPSSCRRRWVSTRMWGFSTVTGPAEFRSRSI